MENEIKVDFGGFVTDENYVYECDECSATCDRENITIDDNGQQLCPNCKE